MNFWKFVDSVDREGTDLILDGEISSTTWFGDEVTPEAFRKELKACKGDVTVHINSPGGDVFAGVAIYNALKDYSKGKVLVKVDGLAASAASVIAMAGDEVIMAPGSMMMVHNPSSMGWGNADELRAAAETLEEITDSIIPIYTDKTGLSEEEVREYMDNVTWMSAEKAVELGFADSVAKPPKKCNAKMSLAYSNNFAFSMSATNAAMSDLMKKIKDKESISMNEDENKKIAENVEVQEDGTITGEVDGEKVELTPDEETKKEIEESEAEEELVDEANKEEENAEEKTEEEDVETEDKTEDIKAEAEAEANNVADKIEAEIKALKEENAELKAKLEELTAANAQAQNSLNAQNRLQARYAAILNMAEEAEGGEVSGEKEAEKPVDTYAKSIAEAFNELN